MNSKVSMLLDLSHLLRLGDESLLQRLNLRHEFICLRISCFKFPPSMHIHRILYLLRKCFHLELLLDQLLRKIMNFPFHILNRIRLRFEFLDLVNQISYFALPYNNISKSLLILHFPFFKSRLVNLNLLIKQCSFSISTNQLCTYFLQTNISNQFPPLQSPFSFILYLKYPSQQRLAHILHAASTFVALILVS